MRPYTSMGHRGPSQDYMETDTKFAQDFALAPGFKRHLEQFYDKATPEDQARCLELITSIDIGAAARQEEDERRKKVEEQISQGVYYPQPPQTRRPKSAYPVLENTMSSPCAQRMGPYSTTYKREYAVPIREDNTKAQKPADTANAFTASHRLSGAMGPTTYGQTFPERPPQRVVFPIQSEKWRNNPQPLEVHFPDSSESIGQRPRTRSDGSPNGEHSYDGCLAPDSCVKTGKTKSGERCMNCSAKSRDCDKNILKHRNCSKTPKRQFCMKCCSDPSTCCFGKNPNDCCKDKDPKNCCRRFKGQLKRCYDEGVNMTLNGDRTKCPYKIRDSSQAFLNWRFPNQAKGESATSEWSRELTDDLLDAVCRGQLNSTYTCDYLGLPLGTRPPNMYGSIDPGSTDWRRRVPHTLNTTTRSTYQQPEMQLEYSHQVMRDACNKNKNKSNPVAIGAVPTVSKRSPHMHIKTCTSYNSEFKDPAPGRRPQEARDIGRQLNCNTIHRFYTEASDPRDKEKLLRMMKAMNIQPPSTTHPAASIRKRMRFFIPEQQKVLC